MQRAELPLKQCNHKMNFRAKDGTHSNDAESEVARFKLWRRTKWSKVRSTSSTSTAKKLKHLNTKVTEYVVQINGGSGMKMPMSLVMHQMNANCGPLSAVMLA